MIWKIVLPFLRPLLPVAVDYARTRMRTVQDASERVAAAEESLGSVADRLMALESRFEAFSETCDNQGREISFLNSELDKRTRSARTWALALVAWNIALTILLAVALFR